MPNFLFAGLLDIPVYKSRVQSLHVLFSLYMEFKNSQVQFPIRFLFVCVYVCVVVGGGGGGVGYTCMHVQAKVVEDIPYMF